MHILKRLANNKSQNKSVFDVLALCIEECSRHNFILIIPLYWMECLDNFLNKLSSYLYQTVNTQC